MNDKRAKYMLISVSIGLFISGVTIWPAITELKLGLSILNTLGLGETQLFEFTTQIRESLIVIKKDHPQIMYGYDWLAFAHIVLAILFYGAAKDPVRNRWVIKCGLIMCALIPVLAAIAIPFRSIPYFWFFIDFAFTPAAAIPLFIAFKDVSKIESASKNIKSGSK